MPGISPSAGPLAVTQASFARPETAPNVADPQGFDEFMLRLRTSINHLETLIAQPPGSHQKDQGLLGLSGLNQNFGVSGLAGSSQNVGLPGLPGASQNLGLPGLPGANDLEKPLFSAGSVPFLTALSPSPGASGLLAVAKGGYTPGLGTSPNGGRIVQAATQLQGSPYVWGGSSPSGFDCSGFTWYAAKQAGITLPQHDLAGQKASGGHVDQADLQPGDLVFFQNTYQPGLSHVGIALGDGRFIHAASETQGVIVSHLNEPYWAQRYVGGTRL
ncbi:MAG TPA: C40 family peptidase [Chloroflexota bacterium]